MTTVLKYKGKVHPKKCHEGPEKDYMLKLYCFFNLGASMGAGVHDYALAYSPIVTKVHSITTPE